MCNTVYVNCESGISTHFQISVSELLHPKCSPLVVRWTQSTLSSIVIVRLPDKQEMQGSIPCEGDCSFVPFCCYFITLLFSPWQTLSYHLNYEIFTQNRTWNDDFSE